MTTGALVLAVSGIFATKANKKFQNVMTAVGYNINYIFVIRGATFFTTVGSTLPEVWVQLLTTFSNKVVAGPFRLFTAVEARVPIYYK